MQSETSIFRTALATSAQAQPQPDAFKTQGLISHLDLPPQNLDRYIDSRLIGTISTKQSYQPMVKQELIQPLLQHFKGPENYSTDGFHCSFVLVVDNGSNVYVHGISSVKQSTPQEKITIYQNSFQLRDCSHHSWLIAVLFDAAGHVIAEVTENKEAFSQSDIILAIHTAVKALGTQFIPQGAV